MGVFTRTVISLDAGEATTIKGPTGTSGVKKLYLTSANLTYGSVQTDSHVNSLAKSVNTNYAEGYYPLNQSASEVTVTVYGMGSAEAVTIIVEWE